jgi:DNA-binding XRE family transcriptional regulator
MPSTPTAQNPGDLIASREFAEMLPAFDQAGAEPQAAVREASRTINDPLATAEEREQANATIARILFSLKGIGTLGRPVGREERTDLEKGRVAQQRRERQQAFFAERLEKLLREKNLTQTALAEKIGVGQPAVSMMLSRRCYPRRRTVEKIAEALNVAVSELWQE